jgi:hypothetical protein
MTTSRSWVTAGLQPAVYDEFTRGLPASRLWSVLLEVAKARAVGRQAAELVEQWDRDRFVQPSIVDQRTLVEVDGHLLGATAAFESIELSPVAPLGVCTIMGHASQNKVLSALRGTEVVSDPTNVMALECARRLRREPATVVRLATSHAQAKELRLRSSTAAHSTGWPEAVGDGEGGRRRCQVEISQEKGAKRVLALPDLEHAKTAVLNSLTSASGQRTYDHAIREFVAWYCSEPRLAFNRTVVLRYRIHLEQRGYAPATINLRLAAVRRIAYEAADAGLLSPELAAGIRRVKGVRRIGVRLGNWLTPEQGRRLLECAMPSTARELRDHAMVAMLIGCGLRRAELLALRLESIQQREEHWVIADLVGKGGHVRTVPSPPG